jgi:hypothetical protein
VATKQLVELGVRVVAPPKASAASG